GLTVNGPVNISGPLNYTGSSSFFGPMNIESTNLSISGTANITGSTNIFGSLNLSGNLNQTGTSTFIGPVIFNAPITANNTSLEICNLNVDCNLNVSGSVNITGPINITGGSTFGGGITVEGDSNFNDSLTIIGGVLTGYDIISKIIEVINGPGNGISVGGEPIPSGGGIGVAGGPGAGIGIGAGGGAAIPGIAGGLGLAGGAGIGIAGGGGIGIAGGGGIGIGGSGGVNLVNGDYKTLNGNIISNSGNLELGLGDANVGGDLNVTGTSNLEDLNVSGAANFECDVFVGCNLYLNATTSPAIGNIYKNFTTPFLHDFGIDNLFIGPNAGNFSLGISTKNIGIGSKALSGLTLLGGNQNTAIGFESLKNNTTGSQNTALGSETLTNNTSGLRNTALGTNALSFNAIGSNNTAVGANTLVTNDQGSNNTAIGSNALQFNQDQGSNNTAVGSNSLRNNLTGSSNASFGYQSLNQNTTGSNNTAIGTSALIFNTTGGNNTALGYNSLAGITYSSNNTVIGTNAAALLTDPSSNNIFIGNNSGINILTSDNSIIIGNSGVVSDTDLIRIGTQGTQNRTFIAGIYGNSIPGIPQTVIINANGELGSVPPSSPVIDNIFLADSTAVPNGNIYKNGDLFLHNFGCATNTFLGTNAGNLTLTGCPNTGIGAESLNLLSTGFNNTAVGFEALFNVNTGVSNTALGDNAGFPITSGDNNILLGENAGSNLIGSSSGNILIGNDGLPSDNFVIGIGTVGTHLKNFQAGIRGVTAGIADTGVVSIDPNGQLGTGIITNNINVTGSTSTEGVIQKNGNRFISNPGNNNTFIGVNAGTLTVGGNSNTSIGTVSLNTISSGNQNVAVGRSALNVLTTGQNNVAVGAFAGLNLLTGTANIIIGNAAGQLLAGSESANILIGNLGTAGDNQTIRIGTFASQTRNFQAGIRGVTAAIADTSVVSIDSNGQLGTGIIINNINITGSTSTGGNILKNGILFIHNTGLNNSFFGLATGNNTLTGTSNTAVGRSNMTTITSGSSNTSVGESAAFSLTTGARNTAIGTAALFAVSTGSDNTALGRGALTTIGVGSGNIGIGSSAGSLLSGNNNIVIGNTGTGTDSGVIRIGTAGTHTTNFQAGIRGVTAAALNTAVVSIDTNGQLGTGIITNNINLTGSTSTGGVIQRNGSRFISNPGASNTFIGETSGNLTLSGLNNTATGRNTLTSITNGNNNVAVGSNALNLTTSGNNNIAIGFIAGITLTTGSNNICIGNNAGAGLRNNNNNTICIGAPGDTLSDRKIWIGNNNDHDFVNIVPGTTTCFGVLHVNNVPDNNIADFLNTYPLVWNSGNNRIEKSNSIISSKKYKENITNIPNETIDRFKTLSSVQFNYKTSNDKRLQYGFIAEETDTIMPELTLKDEEGTIHSIQYSLFYALLHQWIKQIEREQNNYYKEIIALQNKITQQELTIQYLANEIALLKRLVS
ncbi:hypothetical protein EKK58_07245, partial [Candidatus Dependentiae bacterium]